MTPEADTFLGVNLLPSTLKLLALVEIDIDYSKVRTSIRAAAPGRSFHII